MKQAISKHGAMVFFSQTRLSVILSMSVLLVAVATNAQSAGELNDTAVDAVETAVDESVEMVKDSVDVSAAEETVSAAAQNEVVEVAAELTVDEQATKDALIAKGQELYTGRCGFCHGAEGQGQPGAFPAIAGSPVVNGDVEDHLNVVMNGRPGTAMSAFARQMSDEDLAAVVTFQRNSFGNTAGDLVLPADVEAKRQ